MQAPSDSATVSTRLSSPRLWLRCYAPEMALPFWQVIQENRHRLQTDFPDRSSAVVTIKDAERRIRAITYQWNTGELYSFGLWTKETNEYVGDMTLRRLTKGKPYAEIGYYLAAEAEGKGYATEGLLAVLRFAFQELRMEYVNLRCGQDNEKSQRVAERCGFTRSKNVALDFSNPAAKEGRPIYTYRLQRDDAAALALWEAV